MSEIKLHGGVRAGAGRKRGSELTKLIRVPESVIVEIKDYVKALKKEHEIDDIRQVDPITKIAIPLATERVQAGFPSPAQDYIEKTLDLNEFLVSNLLATFVVRANSLSMLQAGIDINDALIVDKSMQAQHRDIVIACVDNEFTVKRLMIDESGYWLKAENEGYPDIHFKEGQEFEIWGVVTNVIKKLK